MPYVQDGLQSSSALEELLVESRSPALLPGRDAGNPEGVASLDAKKADHLADLFCSYFPLAVRAFGPPFLQGIRIELCLSLSWVRHLPGANLSLFI